MQNLDAYKYTGFVSVSDVFERALELSFRTRREFATTFAVNLYSFTGAAIARPGAVLGASCKRTNRSGLIECRLMGFLMGFFGYRAVTRMDTMFLAGERESHYEANDGKCATVTAKATANQSSLSPRPSITHTTTRRPTPDYVLSKPIDVPTRVHALRTGSQRVVDQPVDRAPDRSPHQGGNSLGQYPQPA